MKNLLLVVFLCVGNVTTLQADGVIGFDDLAGGLSKPILPGYHLLNWVGFQGLNGTTYPVSPSGLQVGATSPPNVLVPSNTTNGSISAGMFDLLSVNATSAFQDDLQLEAKGYFKGVLVWDQTNVLSATSPTMIQYNFYGVDQVDFRGAGGTPHAGYPSFPSLTHLFGLDDISVVTYVPYSPGLGTNGGFESGGFSGWSTNGNFNVTVETNFVHTGHFGAKMGPAPTPDVFVETNAPTDIGRLYTVSFWVRNLGAGTNNVGVSWNGMQVLGVTNLPAFGFTNYQFDVPAWSRSELLQFQFQSDAPLLFALDDVSVTPKVLVTNGGFETGDFSGWSHQGNTNNDHVSAADLLSGSFGADFGAVNTPATISQPIITQPGQPYLISAWLKNLNGNTPANEFHVSWDGNPLLELTNLSATGWTNIHLTALGGDTLSTLQFGFRNDSDSFLFDEVSVYPVPILQNGGFEFGDFTGWTQSGNTGGAGVVTNKSFLNSGFYGAAIGPVGTPGFLSQTVATVPGQSYVTGFTLSIQLPMTNAEFTVSWNGRVLMDITNSVLGKLPYEFTVPAAGTSSTLQFSFRNDPFYFGLDDVFVSPVQAPVLQPVTRDNNNLVNVSWSAMPGYLYDLQYSTNLTQPNWTSLQGFLLPTSFPMLGIDTNPPEPQRFYRVQLFPPPL